MFELGYLGDNVNTGNPATFTYAINKTIDLNWPSTVEAKVRADMDGYGNVLSVDRGLFSGRYTITLIPQQDMDASVWQNLLHNSLVAAGYPNASFVSMEAGTVSSHAGGASEVISTTASKVGTDIVKPVVGGVVSIAEAGLKPLIPYLVIGAAGLGLYLYLQYKMARKLV
jgi:hypothetical protein